MSVKTIHHERLVFVFGSNLSGKHGKGAALTAKRFFNAETGIYEGLTGNCYAIPTKNKSLKTLSLSDIDPYIERFVEFAYDNPDKQFMVTRIGCGLAGYDDRDIFNIFDSYNLSKNVLLPGNWLKFKNNNTTKIIIAGGRDFNDYNFLVEKCASVFEKIHTDNIEIVSGTQRGADTLGEQFYTQLHNLNPKRYNLVRFPPAWKLFKKPAGVLRNHAMSWYSTDLIAFWDQSSKGTKTMIDIATNDKLNVRKFLF